MAFELNDKLREEADKLGDFIVKDTKRTVEMFNFMKSQKNNTLTDTISTIGKAVTDIALPLAQRKALINIDLTKESEQNSNDKDMAIFTSCMLISDKIRKIRYLAEFLDNEEIDAIAYEIELEIENIKKK